jgi:small GTP-binding protein
MNKQKLSPLTEKYDLMFKILILGDSGVGKSSLFLRYTKNEFNADMRSTIGVEFGLKFLKIEDFQLKIQIWDTAGQERYRAITSSYYKGSHGCFIVYDITNEASFENVEKWYEHVQKEAGKDISIILVGNKCDLENERKVSKEKGQDKAKNLNCAFFETSALSGINIAEIFDDLANNIYEKTGGNKNDDDIDIEIEDDNNKPINLNKNDGETPAKKKCC